MEQSRIYLDLDGVVYPIDSAPESDDDAAMRHEREWWRTSVVQRIGSLGVEVVLSSSWGEVFMQTSPDLASPLGDLAPARALSNELMRTAGSKIGAIAHDLAAHPAETAVWIDDDIEPDAAGMFHELTSHTLVVVPQRSIGLQVSELDLVERYINR